jgi:hypothetical protein
VHESPSAIAQRVLAISGNGGLAAHADEVRDYVTGNFAVEHVCAQWLDVVAPA